MKRQFNKLKNNINNLYIYNPDKAFKEILKFYLANKKNCFNFFHIPKTGGKFIKTFLKANLNEYQFRAFEHIVKTKWINPNYKVIISIRDPINRFISCYYSDIRNYQQNNVDLSPLGKILYKKYPNIESAINGFINKEKEIAYLAQMGFMSSINYWGNKEQFSEIKNLTIIRTEFLKDDLLDFLLKEFSDEKEWSNLINNFQGDKFKQTKIKEYNIDEELKLKLKDFLKNEYDLYEYLISRKI